MKKKRSLLRNNVDYICPGFVDRRYPKTVKAPSLKKGGGERRCEVVKSDSS